MWVSSWPHSTDERGRRRGLAVAFGVSCEASSRAGGSPPNAYNLRGRITAGATEVQLAFPGPEALPRDRHAREAILLPLNAAEIADRPTFVVGFPRSGTSLLRSVISTHPLVQLAPETHFLSTWVPLFPNVDLSDPRGFDEFWKAYTGDGQFQALELDAGELRERIEAAGDLSFRGIFTAVMRAHAELYGKPGWGEKTPAHFEHLDVLFNWYPQARVLFVIRDPRAVVASWLALDSAWTNRPIPWIVAGWKKSAAAAAKWEIDARVNVFRYEDVASGGRVPELFAFLDLDHPAAAMDGRSDTGRPKGAHDPRGPIRSGSIDRWRTALDPSTVAAIEAAAGGEMQRYGYQPTVTGLRRGLAVLKRRLSRWGRRTRRTASRVVPRR